MLQKVGECQIVGLRPEMQKVLIRKTEKFQYFLQKTVNQQFQSESIFENIIAKERSYRFYSQSGLRKTKSIFSCNI